MTFCNYSDTERWNVWKHVAKEYMYIKRVPPSIPPSLSLMTYPMDAMLFPNSLQLPTSICGCNNFKGEWSATPVGKVDQVEKHNLIDENTKSWETM